MPAETKELVAIAIFGFTCLLISGRRLKMLAFNRTASALLGIEIGRSFLTGLLSCKPRRILG